MNKAKKTQPQGNLEEGTVRVQRAAKRVDVTGVRWVLLACVVGYLVSLFLPFAGGVVGWQVLANTAAARTVKITGPELVFSWVSVVGLGVVTTCVLVTKRFVCAVPGWMLSSLAFFVALLAIWVRRTSIAFEEGLRPGAGMYVATAVAAVALFAYIPVIFFRSASDVELAQRQASAQKPDAVAQAQQLAAVSRGEANPLLIDDRRARAMERHHASGRTTKN